MTSQAQAGASNSSSIPYRRFGGKMGSFDRAQAVSFSSDWTSKLGSFGNSASGAAKPAPKRATPVETQPHTLVHEIGFVPSNAIEGQRERDETHEAPFKSRDGPLTAQTGQANLMTAAQLPVNASAGHYSQRPDASDKIRRISESL